MIPQLVYMLCALTSLGCAFLLLKAYSRNHTGLLFWSGLFFSLIAVSNILLVIDLVIVPEVDLSILRSSITAVAHLMLIIGLLSKPS